MSIVPLPGKEVVTGGSIFRNKLDFSATKTQGESAECRKKDALWRFFHDRVSARALA